MATRVMSPEGLQRCAEGGRKRMAQMTPEQRQDLATKWGENILQRYGVGFYASLGRKSAKLRAVVTEPA